MDSLGCFPELIALINAKLIERRGEMILLGTGLKIENTAVGIYHVD
jgi:hypothetical protein